MIYLNIFLTHHWLVTLRAYVKEPKYTWVPLEIFPTVVEIITAYVLITPMIFNMTLSAAHAKTSKLKCIQPTHRSLVSTIRT